MALPQASQPAGEAGLHPLAGMPRLGLLLCRGLRLLLLLLVCCRHISSALLHTALLVDLLPVPLCLLPLPPGLVPAQRSYEREWNAVARDQCGQAEEHTEEGQAGGWQRRLSLHLERQADGRCGAAGNGTS